VDPSYRIAILAGDGVGPEVMAEALPLLHWARSRGRRLDWEPLPHGADHFLATGETLSTATFERLREDADAILFGAVGDPRIPDGRHAEQILLALRQRLELGLNLRPCAPILDAFVPLMGVGAERIRLEVFRENTEGPYCLRGSTEGTTATDLAVHTEPAVRRLLSAAFKRAEDLGRPLVLAHKANVLKHGHGLWMKVFSELRQAHHRVQASAMHADALLCALVQRPQDFGVIAADNYLGDLISDLTAAFLGGMGMAPSANLAPHRPFRCAGLFEPVHGSAPDLAGQGLANPTGMILSTALMFRYLGWEAEAQAVEASVEDALLSGARTRDLGGSMTTAEMGAALRAGLA
jgi:3-isopropylmalate dehydrogenase